MPSHAAPAMARRAGPVRAPSDAAGPSPKGERLRILIVEDEWIVSLEIEAALEDAGYEVVGVAESAHEAVALAEQHRPDLTLMDVRLASERDGVDTATEIYQRLGLRSIFISANRDPVTRERAQAAHPFGWVPKPFTSEALLAAVRDALRDG